MHKVYNVVVAGRRARFVSKAKVNKSKGSMDLKNITPDELALLVNQKAQASGFDAKVWRKHGLCRVYLNKDEKPWGEIRYDSDEKFKQLQYGMKWQQIEAILDLEENISEQPSVSLEQHLRGCLEFLKKDGRLKPGIDIEQTVAKYSKRINAADSDSCWEIRSREVFDWLGGNNNKFVDLAFLERTAKEADIKFRNFLKADKRDETTKKLDAMYGRGNWDRWDYEDEEG